MLKILHTGDIHLDAPVFGLPKEYAELRRKENLDSFLSLLSYAGQHDVDFVLIAGDLFEAETVTPETLSRVQDAFSYLPCPAVIAPGEADFAGSGTLYKKVLFPPNVFVFERSEVMRFTFAEQKTDIYGFGFTGKTLRQNPMEDTAKKDDHPDYTTLFLCHADLGRKNSEYCPITRKNLADFGADYIALGHRHNAPAPATESHMTYAYCGGLEGNSFAECGKKGALLVEISRTDEGAKVRTRSVPFSQRQYETDTVDCTNVQSTAETVQRIEEKLTQKGYARTFLLHITLTGRTDFVPDTKQLAEHFKERFYMEFSDETVPALREETLTACGTFCHKMEEQIRNRTEREKRIATLAMRYGLDAMTFKGHTEKKK